MNTSSSDQPHRQLRRRWHVGNAFFGVLLLLVGMGLVVGFAEVACRSAPSPGYLLGAPPPRYEHSTAIAIIGLLAFASSFYIASSRAERGASPPEAPDVRISRSWHIGNALLGALIWMVAANGVMGLFLTIVHRTQLPRPFVGVAALLCITTVWPAPFYLVSVRAAKKVTRGLVAPMRAACETESGSET